LSLIPPSSISPQESPCRSQLASFFISGSWNVSRPNEQSQAGFITNDEQNGIKIQLRAEGLEAENAVAEMLARVHLRVVLGLRG